MFIGATNHVTSCKEDSYTLEYQQHNCKKIYIYINFYNVAILKGEFSLGGKGKGSQLFWKIYIYKVGSKKFIIWCITACILSLY